MKRLAACMLLLATCAACGATYAPVTPGVPLRFPQDFGAHPGHRIEWWYVTGQLETPRGAMGFQVTFFRLRNPDADGRLSRFAPTQVLFAHAALAEPGHGKLRQAERAARILPPLVEAREGDTQVRIDDWSFVREGNGYRTAVEGSDFALALRFEPTQPLMLQGEAGFSRKGPQGEQASYYYSEPQLRVSGEVRAGGTRLQVRGTAWLDHEWSSELLAADASGWDWLGANLDDGGALMAFRIRDKQGATLWATATRRRDAKSPPQTASAEAVRFEPLRTWTSPRTGTRYPVAMRVTVGSESWELQPLMDDQELDARASTGVLYWEGAVRLEPRAGPAGRGYLELTGYAARLPF